MRLVLFLLLSFFSARSSAFECLKLFEFIRLNKPQTIDLLLEAMAKDSEFKRFLGHYTLVYKSKSLQKATHLEPRAIVYGEDAKTIVTFINKADVHGRDVLELSCWNEPTASFEFFEIDFSNGLPPLDRLATKPTSCLECHGQDPRPNFEAYNTWSGMFGSLSRQGCSYIDKGSAEFSLYNEYLQRSRNSGRYQYLPDTSEFTDHTTTGYGLAMCPTYKLNQTLESDSAEHETIVEPSTVQFINAFSREPNAQLLDLLTPLNSKRVARMISKQKNYEAFQYAMHGLALSCDFATFGFMPEALEASGATLASTKSDTRETIEAEYQMREKQFLLFNRPNRDSPLVATPINFGLNYVNEVSEFRFMLEKLGLPFRRITMGFDSGTYDFSTNNSTADRIIADIIMKAYNIDTMILENQPTCEELASKSRAALANFKPVVSELIKRESVLTPLESNEIKRAEVVFKTKCLSCHSTNQIEIPLREPEKVKNRILGIHLKGRPQMPLGQPLEVEDQLLLIRYIENLNN